MRHRRPSLNQAVPLQVCTTRRTQAKVDAQVLNESPGAVVSKHKEAQGSVAAAVATVVVALVGRSTRSSRTRCQW